MAGFVSCSAHNTCSMPMHSASEAMSLLNAGQSTVGVQMAVTLVRLARLRRDQVVALLEHACSSSGAIPSQPFTDVSSRAAPRSRRVFPRYLPQGLFGGCRSVRLPQWCDASIPLTD